MQQSSMQKSQYRIPLFCMVTMFFWFAMYTYVPILAPYVEQLGASHKLAGIILGSYGFTQMLLRIPIGIISDTIHKRKIFIIFGLLFTFISGLGLFLFKNLGLVLLFRGAAGIAAATWVGFTILFSSYYSHGEATRAVGTISFYNSIAQMTAMFLGGWVAESFGWEAPFLLGTVVGLIGLVASFFVVEKFEETPTKITLKELLLVMSDRTLIAVSFLAILSQVLTFSTSFGFTPVFAKELGATKYELGLLTVFSTLPTAIASLVGGGYFSQKIGEKKVVMFGFVLMAIFTLSIPFTTNLWVLILTQALSGFGRGFAFPVLMGLSIKNINSDKRATAMGFFQAVYGIGMFVGPVVTGMLGDSVGLHTGFIFLGAIGFITAGLAQLLIKRKQEA